MITNAVSDLATEHGLEISVWITLEWMPRSISVSSIPVGLSFDVVEEE
jgi:hypothetical protein